MAPRNHIGSDSPTITGAITKKRIALSLLVVAIGIMVSVFCLGEPMSHCSAKTFSMIHVGMPETEVFELLGQPGWKAGFGRTAIAIGRIRPYFSPGGIRESGDGEMTKAWADNDGIIIITFKDGHVMSMSFEPVFFAPTYTITQ